MLAFLGIAVTYEATDRQLAEAALYQAVLISKRSSFRRTMKRGLEESMDARAKGINVQLVGRFGGAEMARREKQISASIPLSITETMTPQGHIEVQVWTNQGSYGEETDGDDAQTGKTSKVQRGPIIVKATRDNKVVFGDFGLQSLESGWLSSSIFLAKPKNAFGFCSALASKPPDNVLPDCGHSEFHALASCVMESRKITTSAPQRFAFSTLRTISATYTCREDVSSNVELMTSKWSPLTSRSISVTSSGCSSTSDTMISG